MFEKKKSDGELLHALKKGSKPAFAELYNRYYRSAFRVAFSVLGNVQEAEGATDEFFASLLENPFSVDEMRPFSPYVFSGAKNRALNLRKWQRKPHEELEEDANAAEAERSQSISEETMAFLGRILSDEERSVYVLHLAYSYTFAEIAASLGCSEDAASSIFSRARKKVQSYQGDLTELRS